MVTRRAKKGRAKVVRARVLNGPGRVVNARAGIDLGSAIDMIKYARFIPVVISIVSSIQILRGPGGGAEKKAAALVMVGSALALYEGLSEKDAIDDAEFMALASTLIELGLKLMALQPEVEKVAQRIRGLKPKVTT